MTRLLIALLVAVALALWPTHGLAAELLETIPIDRWIPCSGQVQTVTWVNTLGLTLHIRSIRVTAELTGAPTEIRASVKRQPGAFSLIVLSAGADRGILVLGRTFGPHHVRLSPGERIELHARCEPPADAAGVEIQLLFTDTP